MKPIRIALCIAAVLGACAAAMQKLPPPATTQDPAWWFKLRAILGDTRAPDVFRAAAAFAFHDWGFAEPRFAAILRAPHLTDEDYAQAQFSILVLNSLAALSGRRSLDTEQRAAQARLYAELRAEFPQFQAPLSWPFWLSASKGAR